MRSNPGGLALLLAAVLAAPAAFGAANIAPPPAAG
jgi:hypothetical protein